ncbi:MAG: RNA-binding S4 domain-containing protein [Paludibacteraceae bacterium]
MDEVRIDKWLWAVRLFKTRSLATEACKKGRIFINNISVKPSRVIKTGDIIGVKYSPVLYSFKVLALLQNRIGPKLVSEYREDVTTPDQLQLIELGKIAAQSGRARGAGRPTKKERREMDDFFEPYFIDDGN